MFSRAFSIALTLALPTLGWAAAADPAPAQGVADAPPERASERAPEGDKEKKATRKKRIELDGITIEGEAQKPGVVFIDGGKEQLRRAMQGLLGETRTGGTVSQPRDHAALAARVVDVKVRGLDERAVRGAIEDHAGALARCGGSADTTASFTLRVDDGGRVSRSKLNALHPDAPKVGACLSGQLAALKLPAPVAGSGRVDVTLALPRVVKAAPPSSTGPEVSAPDDARALPRRADRARGSTPASPASK